MILASLARGTVAIGERVRIHFNLHTHLWSVTALEGPQKGRVVAHLENCSLENCRFIVSAAGRARVLRDHCRAVHAWVEGTFAEISEPVDAVGFTYNPYRGESFTRRDNGAELNSAQCCWFIGQQAYTTKEESR